MKKKSTPRIKTIRSYGLEDLIKDSISFRMKECTAEKSALVILQASIDSKNPKHSELRQLYQKKFNQQNTRI